MFYVEIIPEEIDATIDPFPVWRSFVPKLDTYGICVLTYYKRFFDFSSGQLLFVCGPVKQGVAFGILGKYFKFSTSYEPLDLPNIQRGLRHAFR